MDTHSVVLSSSRAIRHAQFHTNETFFLPRYLTIGEFISKLCIVEGYTLIDEDTRLLLLLEASDFNAFSKLHIERNFFTFTKNSSYIFKFFEELAVELCEIEQLHNADVYADYEEHITILTELYKRYEKLCNQHKLLDPIFLPRYYTLNTAFLKQHPVIEVHVDGYLSNFEMQLLQESLQYSQIDIHWCATPYNTKMHSRFQSLGFAINAGYCYTLDLNNTKIKTSHPLQKSANTTCVSVSEGVLQIGFIKHKVFEFVSKGLDPNKIVVILPDEQKAELIRTFDREYNFNFAMGRSFTQSLVYKTLDAALQALEQNSQENRHRAARYDENVQEYLFELFGHRGDLEAIAQGLERLLEYCDNKTEQKIVQEELHSFSKILPFMQEMGVKSILKLFMQRLARRSFDDVSGGKITVMGVLESRGIDFDGVIIIDFNENNVPKRSDKDMFLNTAVREMAGLPTLSDREGLQKHYYAMVIHRAKEIAISYVASADAQPSRFLKQLGVVTHNTHKEHHYASVLFQHHTAKTVRELPVQVSYDFTAQSLSNSALKSYLTCSQQFFYRYIAHLKGHEIPKDLPQEHEIGNDIHKALCNLYKENKRYDDVALLQRDLEKELDRLEKNNELVKFQIALHKKHLRNFCALEITRFAQGYAVYATEIPLKAEFCGMQLSGVIDRIDIKDGQLYVLDYKTGSYQLYTNNSVTDALDFQLEFYKILASQRGEVASCAFYDLKECKIVEERLLDVKMEVLEKHLEALRDTKEFTVQKCEDHKHCLYCDYKILCGRE